MPKCLFPYTLFVIRYNTEKLGSFLAERQEVEEISH
jgi:hypothetical protein